jgi:hypothetical protein
MAHAFSTPEWQGLAAHLLVEIVSIPFALDQISEI